MKGEEVKIKYAMVEEGRKMKCDITTGLFSQQVHHILGMWAKPASYLKI
jgi:hypothetical protein